MSEIESARLPRPPSLTDALVAVGALIALVSASFLLSLGRRPQGGGGRHRLGSARNLHSAR
jgi:hypothetical protein